MKMKELWHNTNALGVIGSLLSQYLLVGLSGFIAAACGTVASGLSGLIAAAAGGLMAGWSGVIAAACGTVASGLSGVIASGYATFTSMIEEGFDIISGIFG